MDFLRPTVVLLLTLVIRAGCPQVPYSVHTHFNESTENPTGGGLLQPQCRQVPVADPNLLWALQATEPTHVTQLFRFDRRTRRQGVNSVNVCKCIL